MPIYDEQDFERKFKNLQERKDVIPQNQRDIIEFLKFMKIMNRGTHRRIRYLQNLITLSRLLGKPFRKMTRKDAETLLAKIKEQGWTPSTELNLKIELKRFMAWLRKCERRQYPKEVNWIECGGDVKRKLSREELLIDEDVKKLIDTTNKTSYKAMISLLYQTGIRPTELIDLKVKDFVCENGIYGIRVRGTKSASADREIPVIDVETIKLVNECLEEHSMKKTPEFKESALWTSANGKPIEYGAFREFLRYSFVKAEIKKPSYPYNFRHSRANAWANDPRIPQMQFNYLMGHSQSSRVISTYRHPVKKDVFDNFMKFSENSPDNLSQQAEDLANEMENEAIKDEDYAKAKLIAWSKNSPTKFKRWDSLLEQLVKCKVLVTRGQRFRKTLQKR